MITRGHFIGSIVDRLSEVAHQADSRSDLGLTDLNRFAEDFFKDLANSVYSYSLTSANADRCNAPGIDLIDASRGIGVQVTSTKTAQKINETLRVASGLANCPGKILVLIIGKKQGTYTGLDRDLCSKTNFSESNIFDIMDLCRSAMSLDIDRLAAVHSLVQSNTQQLKIELETPLADGSYPTSAFDFFERIPRPTPSDCSIYHNFLVARSKTEKTKYNLTLVESAANVKDLISRLKKLPRVSREVLVWLITHRDQRQDDAERGTINYLYVKKMSRWDGLDDDIRLLDHEGLVSYNDPDYEGAMPTLSIRLGGETDYFWDEFTAFVEGNRIGYINPIVHLDFRSFGPNPVA